MTKSYLGIALSILLLVAAALGEYFFIGKSLSDFREQTEIVLLKAQSETATAEDGEILLSLWENQKKKLHVIIPHGDVEDVDNVIAEAVGALRKGDFSAATAKLYVVVTVCESLPQTYRPTFGNLF